MPSTTNHSYVKFEMLYSTTKNEKLRKKVAYPHYLIAGMQLLSLYIVHEHKFFNTLLADNIIFAVCYTGCNSLASCSTSAIFSSEHSAISSIVSFPIFSILSAVCFFVRISSTAFSRVSCCQRCLMICCCNWDIRFVVYRSSQFMSGEGMNLSGSLEMIENSMSSALLWRFEKNSLDLLWSLISMFIVINSNL